MSEVTTQTPTVADEIRALAAALTLERNREAAMEINDDPPVTVSFGTLEGVTTLSDDPDPTPLATPSADMAAKLMAAVDEYEIPRATNRLFWNDVGAESSRIALVNGYDVTTWENVPAKLMFVVGELVTEAGAAVRNNSGPSSASRLDDLGEELADVVIRLASILHDLWPDIWLDRSKDMGIIKHRCPWVAFQVAAWQILDYLGQAAEAWRHDKKSEVLGWLENAIAGTIQLAHDASINIEDEVRKKCARNLARPHLHGKATSVG